jgi:hypothetical protein
VSSLSLTGRLSRFDLMLSSWFTMSSPSRSTAVSVEITQEVRLSKVISQRAGCLIGS